VPAKVVQAMGLFERQIVAELDAIKRQALYRQLRTIESAHGPRVNYNGRNMLMLASNNYLGLAAHPALKRAAADAAERFGTGAGASRLIAGNLSILSELEARLAQFKGVEAALVFGSGYLANLGTISAVAGREDVILSDELNHASLIDGCRLARAEVRIYRHGDADHLRSQLLESRGARRRIIVTDSVFSMDGDLAPLAEIVELARRHDAAVMVDEAHAVGVLGPRGAGLACALGLERDVDIQMGTLSKSLGSYGAYVAGSRALIDLLINRARSFVFTTGLPPASAAAAIAALDLIEAEPQRIKRLWDNGCYLHQALTRAGFKLGASATPILPLIVGEAQPALDFAEGLLRRGVFVLAIRPPTVPPATARLRVTPTADHTRADLDEALSAFIAAGREAGVIPA
jgi:8-amino-7-oxononanoate synthase